MSLPRSTPEAEGIPSSAVLAFLDGIGAAGVELHSFILLRHGKVVAEGWWHPYRREDVHFLYSLSKSFTSTAVGFAVSEGLLTVEDKVLSFFPKEAPQNPSENLRAMRVQDLLTMSTGHAAEDLPALMAAGPIAPKFFSLPVPYQPGTHFAYNNGATYMLAAILARLTGITLLEYLRPRLFDPLGIDQATWVSDAEGINLGATGLSVTTESIAKFGQLLLQDGMWEGRRVLPEGWVAEATRGHVSNATNESPDWRQGYGYQFWRCRHGAYRGDGAFGQNCVVMPAQDAVFTTTAGAHDLQAILDQCWQHILPAVTSPEPQSRAIPDHAPRSEAPNLSPPRERSVRRNDEPGEGDKTELVKSPIPASLESEVHLLQRCRNLNIPGPEGAPTSPLTPQIDGKTYRHPEGSFTFNLSSPEPSLTIRLADKEHRIPIGLGEWKYGQTAFDSDKEQPIATYAAWPDPSTFVLRIQYILLTTHTLLTCRFEENHARIHLTRAATFQPADGPDWDCVAD